MTPAKVAPTLPECQGCGTPTRRTVYLENGGRCTPCRRVVDNAARQLELGID